jgi:hypothetical protein
VSDADTAARKAMGTHRKEVIEVFEIVCRGPRIALITANVGGPGNTDEHRSSR